MSWQFFSTCVDIKDPRPHFLWWTLKHNELCFNTGSLTLLFFSHISRESSVSSGLCVLTSISIFSNLVECVDFSDLSGATEGWFISFFRINNIELRFSFVWCRKYHKSWWNGAAELQITVDLLCGTTAAKLHYSVDLLYGTTAAQLHNSIHLLSVTPSGRRATQLGRFTLWHNGSRAKQPGFIGACTRSHTRSKDSAKPCGKLWRLNPK